MTTLGMGTWRMGERESHRAAEVAALRTGLDLGLAIPKAGTVEHVRENAGALRIRLTDEDLADLDDAFPPPDGPQPLEML